MNIPLYLVTGATGGHALGSLLVEDHHAGLFAGTNDLVRQITGRAPLSIEEFASKRRAVLVAS